MELENADIEEGSQLCNIFSRSILTNREIEYLSLAALGYPNPMIAKILTVTRSTVKKTFETVFRKLSARARTQAVTIAFIHQILSEKVLSEIRDKYNLNSHSER